MNLELATPGNMEPATVKMCPKCKEPANGCGCFYKPPSCELEAEDKQPKLKPCPICECSLCFVDGIWVTCQRCKTELTRKYWNPIPRRSEVNELLRLVDEAWWEYLDCREVLENVGKAKDYADKLRKEYGL